MASSSTKLFGSIEEEGMKPSAYNLVNSPFIITQQVGLTVLLRRFIRKSKDIPVTGHGGSECYETSRIQVSRQ
jgi:hypothetical protein